MKNFKISKIQQILKDKNIDSLIINRTDEFLNEYIPQDAERLFWATDFSGSAGRAIISQNNANLFVDGRYTFQAKEQIDCRRSSICPSSNASSGDKPSGKYMLTLQLFRNLSRLKFPYLSQQ